MFDLSFRHVLLLHLVKNGVGVPASGWIRRFEGFVCASLWQNQCMRANDCTYLLLYPCQHNSLRVERNPAIRRFIQGGGEGS